MVRLWEAGLFGGEGDRYVCGRRVSLGVNETLRYYGTSVGGGSLWEEGRQVCGCLWECVRQVLWYVCGRRVSLGVSQTGTSVGAGFL